MVSKSGIRLVKNSRSVLHVLVAIVLLLGTSVAKAHIVVEDPWHPLAASYQTMNFMANLKPVPWQKIEKAFTEKLPAAFGSKSARESLAGADGKQNAALISAIEAAIQNEDRQALFAAASRALSGVIRHQLTSAEENLEQASVAIKDLEEAQALYRAVAPFIQQADPDAFRQLGRAWLGLSSSVGTASIGSKAAVAADREAFALASKTLSTYLQANYEPEQFTRREKLEPLPESVVRDGAKVESSPWLPPGTNFNDQRPFPLLVLNFERQGVDERDLPLIAYGDMLFDSPDIYAAPARENRLACSTCHNRSDVNQTFNIPGISHQAGAVDVDGQFFNPMFNDRRDDSLDMPSLRGIRFTGPYGRDGREASLRDFTRNVIVNEFGGAEPTAFMLDALIAYMTEFDFLPNSKLDEKGKLTDKASESALRGEKLFRKPFAQMDDKSCASCHNPSSNFIDRRSHSIGSAAASYPDSRDGAFDTPTLLGTQFTAPYFHDGSLPTLASVVDWFDMQYSLGLTDDERGDLTAYVEAVGDADQAYEVFEGKNTAFALAFDELTTFASTLDVLLPAQDDYHASILIDTVATDLTFDAAGMINAAYKGTVYEMVRQLEMVGDAIDRKDWDAATAQWDEFKKMEQQYAPEMY